MHNFKTRAKVIIGSIVAAVLLLCVIGFDTEIFVPKSDIFLTGKEWRALDIKRKKERRANGYSKPDKPSEYINYHNAIRTPDGGASPSYSANNKIKELREARGNIMIPRAAGGEQLNETTLNWIERGPGNVSGRTRGLIIDPDDKTGNTWFTGSVGGGIWKTTDAGKSWKNLTPKFPNLSTVCIAMAPSNHNVIYAGTGEGFHNTDAIKGAGMFKSTDRGSSWTQLNSTINVENFEFINRIIVDPENADILLAVTNSGIYKSKDGGVIWSEKFSSATRVQHIVANPVDFKVQFAGVNGKGVIKTTDGGETWNWAYRLSEGRVELAIAPSNTNVIYALSEQSNLHVSADNGESWQRAEVTSGSKLQFLSKQGWYNNTLAVAPDDPNKIYIGGVNVFLATISSDGTTTKKVYTASEENTQSFMKFINFGGDYLGGGMEVAEDKSLLSSFEIRFGDNYKQKAHRFTVPQGGTKGVPASSYSYEDYVEVPFQAWDTDNNRQLMVSFRDQDRNGIFNLTAQDDEKLIGREYIFIHSIEYVETPSVDITVKGGHEHKQMSFIWPVLVDDASWDPDKLPESKLSFLQKEVVAKNLHSKMLAHWAGDGAPYVHADNHNIQITKSAGEPYRIVVANDGGVGYSDDGGMSWTNPSNGYNTTQLYGVDRHPSMRKYIGGMQDNGSWLSKENPGVNSVWKEATGGDGFDVIWHASKPDTMVTSLYYNRLYVSYNDGKTFTRLTTSSNIDDYGDRNKAPFITQIAYSTITPDRIFLIGASGVTRTEDFGKTWQTIKIEADWGYSGSGKIAISGANPEIVWAGCKMSSAGKLHVSTDGGKTFRVTKNFTQNMGSLSGLATHPTLPNTAFALFSFNGLSKILRTDDLGETWKDISGFSGGRRSTNGFPNVAVYSLLVMPYNTNEIWVGTEIGLFVSKDDGANWALAGDNLPAVSIWDMKVRGEEVVIATHGRGVWSTEMEQLSGIPKAPIIIEAGQAPDGKGIVRYKCLSNFDYIDVLVDNNKVFRKTTVVVAENSEQLKFDLSKEQETHTLQLVGYKNDKPYYSGSVLIKSIQLQEPSDSYSNDFESENAEVDFIGNGFQVRSYSELTGKALHSEHSYRTKSELVYTLLKPIIVKPRVSDGKAWLRFNDIAMVEPGDVNSVFGESKFYDYVIVEATNDGITWKKLGDGYDFNVFKEEAKSLGINNQNSNPVQELYKRQERNLLEYFSEGDVVLIRFRLYSDNLTTGWGWVIDNIEIQLEKFTGVRSQDKLVTRVYPNPANNWLNVQPKSGYEGVLNMNLYNIQGQRIKSEVYIINSGKEIKWNTNEIKQGAYLLELVYGSKRETHKLIIRH
ncbi:T9SS type A sorting domain-containing protein [Prolixibacteraceae bacterium JC049]|nr:T9SS type A sorting domain-containing protein [Prolixibacteraceae bacterium JC049]